MYLRFVKMAAVVFLLLITSPTWAQDAAREQTLPDKMWDVLRGAVEIDVVAIQPGGTEVFARDWKYSVKSRATGSGVRKDLLDVLEQGVKKAGQRGNGKFVPQYGIRATNGAGTTIELVIDFASGEIHIFSGTQRAVLRTSDAPRNFFARMFDV